jgi:hypothetical protein
VAVFVVEFDAHIALEHGGNMKGAARIGRQAVGQSGSGWGSGGFSHAGHFKSGLNTKGLKAQTANLVRTN